MEQHRSPTWISNFFFFAGSKCQVLFFLLLSFVLYTLEISSKKRRDAENRRRWQPLIVVSLFASSSVKEYSNNIGLLLSVLHSAMLTSLLLLPFLLIFTSLYIFCKMHHILLTIPTLREIKSQNISISLLKISWQENNQVPWYIARVITSLKTSWSSIPSMMNELVTFHYLLSWHSSAPFLFIGHLFSILLLNF